MGLGERNYADSTSMSMVPIVTTRSMSKITFAVLMYGHYSEQPLAIASVGFDYIQHTKKWNMTFCIFPDKAKFSPYRAEVQRACEEMLPYVI